jgi:NAD-dependent deacetylase
MSRVIDNLDQREFEELKGRLGEARRTAALTGAGISAESGVPTFRGADGLWRNYRSQDLATPEAFTRDPKLVWEWYNWRRGLIGEKTPNPGHEALARLERSRGLVLVTQNVDGLHHLAGSRNLIELHGNIWRTRCLDCGRREIDRTVPLPAPPTCPDCGGLVRPDVVWFGEALDMDALTRAFTAAAQADLMLVIGTSALVQPAASMAWEAKRAGTLVVEINLEPTPLTGEADLTVLGPSGRVLPALLAGL